VKIEVVREPSPAAIEWLTTFLDEVTEHDHHTALGEHKWLDLVHGGRPGFTGLVATDPDHDHPIGYAQLSRHHDHERPHWGLEVVVHPEHRGVGVELALVRRAFEVVKEAGGGHLHLWVFQPTPIHDAVAHQLGLERGRDLLHMRVQLPLEHDTALPDGIRIRAFEPGRDEDAWLDLNNRAFAEHPEQGGWDRETLERRMAEPWFDPEDLLLAVDEDGALAGSNWTKLDRERGIGEIYVIAVDPSRHSAGLGKALSVAGLVHMAENGMREGSLYVDSANEKALAMYRAIGFQEHHLDRAYAADVPAA
jgi:mycothiol synthase